METVIKAEDLSKKYRIGVKGSNSFRETVVEKFNGYFSGNGKANSVFWALDHVSFEVKKGEVVGIIGKNGAGKSTLLKILSRITEPTKGRVEILGRVSSLLEVGTGFHPELTGRENVFMNGSILGMRRNEIRKKLDEIVSFSGVEQFIDTPVKRYSSGMYVRLAFAVAAHLEPEILIVDEVLAVGDAEFQRKCLGKMKEVSMEKGRTILFVSHHMESIQSLCTHALWLSSGHVALEGKTTEVVSRYLESVTTSSWSGEVTSSTDKPRITFVAIDEDKLAQGEFFLKIGFHFPFAIPKAKPGFVLYNESGIPVFGSNTSIHEGEMNHVSFLDGVFCASVKGIHLYSGNYYVSAWLGDQYQDYDARPYAIQFYYSSKLHYSVPINASAIGSVNPLATWNVEPAHELLLQ